MAPIDVAAPGGARWPRPGHGALVTFVGRARDVADDGRERLELEYEAYAEMAIAVLSEIARRGRAALGRGSSAWPASHPGMVPIGEAAVAIVTAARASCGGLRGESVRDRGDQGAAADLEARALRRRQRVEAARRLDRRQPPPGLGR